MALRDALPQAAKHRAPFGRRALQDDVWWDDAVQHAACHTASTAADVLPPAVLVHPLLHRNGLAMRPTPNGVPSLWSTYASILILKYACPVSTVVSCLHVDTAVGLSFVAPVDTQSQPLLPLRFAS